SSRTPTRSSRAPTGFGPTCTGSGSSIATRPATTVASAKPIAAAPMRADSRRTAVSRTRATARPAGRRGRPRRGARTPLARSLFDVAERAQLPERRVVDVARDRRGRAGAAQRGGRVPHPPVHREERASRLAQRGIVERLGLARVGDDVVDLGRLV